MILSAALLAAAFDVVALVDSLDFAQRFDIEKSEGTLQVLEHVLRTSATDVWWRDKGGGRLRYPSKEEAYPLSEDPFDRHTVPREDVSGTSASTARRRTRFRFSAVNVRAEALDSASIRHGRSRTTTLP